MYTLAETLYASNPSAYAELLSEGESGVTRNNYFKIVSTERLGQTQPNQFQSSTDEQPTGWIWGSKCTELGVCNESSAQNNALAEMPRSYNENVGTSRIYGYYYNWYAATAETGTFAQTSGSVSDSLCPKGWQLPVDGGINDNYSWTHLLSHSTEGYNLTNSTESSRFMRQVPLSLSFPGYYEAEGTTTSAISFPGVRGYFWASNYQYLYFRSALVDFRSSSRKIDGFSVRCVLK